VTLGRASGTAPGSWNPVTVLILFRGDQSRTLHNPIGPHRRASRGANRLRQDL